MLEFLFVLTFWFSLMFLIDILTMGFGKSCTLPIPFLHFFRITHKNIYVSYPCCMYQVYFWFSYVGVI